MPKALPLAHRLVLNQWALGLFGCQGFEDLAGHLKDDALQGIDAENVHRFCRALLLHVPGSTRPALSDDDLLRYDDNIVRVTRAINAPRSRHEHRPIRWMHFQYLALLFSEIYLERYLNDPATLRLEFNAHIRRFNEGVPLTDRIEPLDQDGDARTQLNKLSFWMATGSGKTLLMHAHIRQYRWHLERLGRSRELNRVILLTPNEGLSRQHLREFEASGIDAELFTKTGDSLFSGAMVEVLEVSKLDDRMGEKKVAVEALEGNNLVLIDEGHRGLSAGEQGAWIRRRDQLCEEGFSFEYSATFAHAIKGGAKQKRELGSRYARSVLFDYSYRWFHGEGFGKDYQIFNLAKERQEEWRLTYLTAALLTFVQQQRVFERFYAVLRPFAIERPLWVFVGGSVTKGFSTKEASDIVDILTFLHGYLSDPTAATNRIRKLLTDGLPAIHGHSLLDDHFTPILQEGLSPSAIYRMSLRLLFNAPGGGLLRIEHLRGTSGELAVRVGENRPFGVVNVGDPKKLANHCANSGLNSTESEFAGSLFHDLNSPQSPVNLLVGARKFTEGWSSWRVSSMGLMNVGRSEGAQIIQLFGRGVRLKGKDGSLKRSSALPQWSSSAPEYIRFLETLQVFGVRADYMSHFRTILQDEGLATDRKVVVVPVEIREPLPPLKVIRIKGAVAGSDPATAFNKVGPTLVLCPPGLGKRESEIRIGSGAEETSSIPAIEDRNGIRDAIDAHLARRPALIDWYPKIRAIRSTGADDGLDEDPEKSHPFRQDQLKHLDLDQLFFDLQRFKSDRGWHNLTICRAWIPTLLAGRTDGEAPFWYRLRIPEREMAFTDFSTTSRWQEVALAVLKKYATSYYAAARQAWEARHLEYQTMTHRDPNYPRVGRASGAEYGYTVEVERTGDQIIDQRLDKAVEQLLEQAACHHADPNSTTRSAGFGELQTLDFQGHLYRPLIKATSQSIRVTPVGLNEGESQFVEHLREFCDGHRDLLEGTTIHLMRNLSRGKGVFFFEANNFYPDFILWAVGSGLQRIAFIDPKGLVHEPPDSPKVNFHEKIKEIQDRLGDRAVSLDSFIVSVTSRERLPNQWKRHSHRWFADRHIVFQQDGTACIHEIFAAIGVVDPAQDSPERLPRLGLSERSSYE